MASISKRRKLFFKGKGNLEHAEVAEDITRELEAKCKAKIDLGQINTFSDLPISPHTLRGLRSSEYIHPTEIQRQAIVFALRGRDVLGAAKTGSGKTLAFIVPVLENLFRKHWQKSDGLGALIVTPVRELAFQIFNVLRQVGEYHDFSAGLIIGGRDITFEKERIRGCNIIVCTPGRFLQHIEESAALTLDNLAVLVLDEADRILDMGFEREMNFILESLPKDRQTLMFSATQTKSVNDLVRVSMKNPVHVSVHEHAEYSTPDTLQQSYLVCELEEKLDLLWSFLKRHSRQKTLVFMTCCKQVRFVKDLFHHIPPGVTVSGLWSFMSLNKRMEVYNTFCESKRGVLISTNLAARGLDFPSIDWIIQYDCPEDATHYIHRVGRTARHKQGGESVLFLMPSELALLPLLEARKVPITKIKVNPKMIRPMRKKFEALLAFNEKLMYEAKTSFVAYLKAVYLMKNKVVFDVTKLNVEAYARSVGLIIVPRVRYLSNRGVTLQRLDQNPGASDSNPCGVSSDATKCDDGEEEEEDDDGDIFQLKKRHLPDCDDDGEDAEPESSSKRWRWGKPFSRIRDAEKMLRKNLKANTKVVFADDGTMLRDESRWQQSLLAQQTVDDDESGLNIELAKRIMREEDHIDRMTYWKRRRAHERELEELRDGIPRQESKREKDGRGTEDDYVEVDVDFLPDPDEIYGKEDEKEGRSSDAGDTAAEPDEELGTGLSLLDDEHLALQLLEAK